MNCQACELLLKIQATNPPRTKLRCTGTRPFAVIDEPEKRPNWCPKLEGEEEEEGENHDEDIL